MPTGSWSMGEAMRVIRHLLSGRDTVASWLET